MPKRDEIFINGYIYHIFNKTIDSRNLFISDEYCYQFLNILKYYRSSSSYLSYSEFRLLDEDIKAQIVKKIYFKKNYRIRILSYCLMPTHFHFLVKQVADQGIKKCFSNTINSFTRVFNLKNERMGPLFITQFKAVLIRTEEQLKHTSRYIHLNPFSAGIVNCYKDLEKYKWSSLRSIVNNTPDAITDYLDILSLFNNGNYRYKKFIENNADYQRSLEKLKYVKNF